MKKEDIPVIDTKVVCPCGDGTCIDCHDKTHDIDSDDYDDPMDNEEFLAALDLLEECLLHLDVLLDRQSVKIPFIQRRMLEKLLDKVKDFVGDYADLEAKGGCVS